MSAPALTSPAPSPSLWQLFYNFAMVGLFGFGGVMPWARQMMVDRRRWVDEPAFNELLTTGQFFPGPNIGNVSIIYGRRQHGLAGACAALFGLYLFPSIITVLAGFAYARWWSNDTVQQVFGAIMPIATGLMLGTTLRLLKAMPRNLANGCAFAVTFVLMGVLVLPLWSVLLICIPLSIALRFIDKRA
ncbi:MULTISPECIES: chromate transporter [unclassified Pseudomonas]|uniref:chromate transporter n=1 Tax=unclassified Pseudomonas TaxID=196821 RepID=UPI000C2F8C16|nr:MULTISPECIES: chromate transporter [unclassified Pseudomonas]MCU1741310.1 chromate transporter [Pseudomonas sp. 20S_6.2_Bac1]